ncbi:hypothetical protein EU245_09605 [Lentibacillus lipolyticus]|nr:hypothetical protein EU245_09605 [Lentibacillus lipolyticus]
MIYVVKNCFHWIGYHIVNRLLEEGCQVNGMDDLSTEKKENLMMFVGRNEQFRHVSINSKNSGHDVTITVDDHMIKLHKEHPVTIKLPLLFGEWMPMREDGVFNGQAYVPFDASEFAARAVHIDDFLTSFVQWIHASSLPSSIIAKSVHDRSEEDNRYDQYLYIRQRQPLEAAIRSVKEHYRKYKEFY